MNLDLDLAGTTVLILGTAHSARRALRRCTHAGAVVRTAHTPADVDLTGLEDVRLVIAVDDCQGGWDDVVARLRRTHLVVREDAAAPGGQVILVGGGPGQDELLTVAGRQALADADVVLYDRLAPHENLAELTHGAELVDVGKRPGHHAITQRGIEELMVDRARAGETVVRLKGGDPYVFGRGSEEVLAARAAGIPVRVVPGITSAVSVPAAAGIPVTHREVSRLFTVISGHVPLTASECEHLAGLGGTIVVLMGIGTMHQTMTGLRQAGMTPDMPVAVVERGYSMNQRTTCSTLGEATSAATLAGCSNPAVLVIGEVVRLGHDWPRELTELAGASLGVSG
ncbi:uroporphyrin-III C-methyltransferase [Sanguibacter keddieii DSM 10542]|uniref:uroporphyrinogen-III C-methyltransferase n=1 Tax=Sanguibacter keddieii (strain ATCC 51767 / DSM 10542 / NCFB 3025 / ST-74) TaxID=446469 RepID=D1BI84_SANKS|nr:uroporphyrinogen-III C-methyltransferase [Sanguibacter keddieii]ACZ20058.1 uroporphyrin-III C-methyltransferase [Sanguibacter keddieii DSM 10542]